MKSRSDSAVEWMTAGGNCAQAVLGAFCSDLGLDRETAMKLASGFGAGMARRQEVCGAVSGAVMAIGLKHGQSRADDKAAKEMTYRLSRELMDRFQAEYGSCLCRDLLPGIDLTTEAGHQRYSTEGRSEKVCRPCVRFAVHLLENIL